MQRTRTCPSRKGSIALALASALAWSVLSAGIGLAQIPDTPRGRLGEAVETESADSESGAGASQEDAAQLPRFGVASDFSVGLGDMLKPQLYWIEWRLEGALVPPRELAILRAFFEPEITRFKAISGAATRHLKAFAQTIGYHLVTITVDTTPNGPVATLRIEPANWVRRVRVTVPFAIFQDEIARRMQLKAGSRLDDDPVEQETRLRVEAVRLETYLRNRGYFEACVEVRCVSGIKTQENIQWRCPDAPGVLNPRRARDQKADLCKGVVEIHVEVKKGPHYEFGSIGVLNNPKTKIKGITKPFKPRCFWFVCWPNNFSLSGLNERLDTVGDLHQRNGYPAVRVRTDFDPVTSINKETEAVDFNIIINERRKVTVEFAGDYPKFFNADSFKKLLTFNAEGSYDDVEAVASANAIRQFFQARGYFEANVVYGRERLAFLDKITFTIDAGPRLRVAKVAFSGNRIVTAKQLRDVVQIAANRYISADTLEADHERIVDYYQKLGFTDVSLRHRVSRSLEDRDNAAVLAALVASGAGQEGLYVRFDIDEGPKTVVNRVDFVFKGDHLYNAEDLGKVVSLKSGAAYHDEVVDAGHEELERFYFKKAHPQASISSKTRLADGQAGTIDVVYVVVENPKVRIGKVLVQGNFKTDDWVILDELGFREGMELSLQNAEVGAQNLRSTGLFDAVRVQFINLDKTVAQDINVLIRVQERYDYKLSLELAGGLTLSSDVGAFIELGAAMPNLWGKGMRLDLRARLGTQFSSVEGKFTAPRWVMRRFVRSITGNRIELPWRFESAAFWRQEQTERFGDLTSVGTSLALSKLFRRGFLKNVLVSARYDLRIRNREEDLIRPTGPSEDIQRFPVRTRTGAFGPQITIDRRRDRNGRLNPLTPQSGYRLDFRALWATPYLLGQDDFFKLGVAGQYFWRPNDWRLLITNSVRYDHGIPRSDVVLPEVERYFAGGDTTVRGFEEDRLATEIIEEPLPPFGNITQLRVLPAGGNIRFIHNLDLQFDVWTIGGSPVSSGVFLDTGLVTNSLEGLDYRDFRHSLGIALARWSPPFGSISIEWAMPLDPKLGDNPRGRWHFNFGLPF